MITWNGLQVEKPQGITHNPQIQHTIDPVEPIPFSLWCETLRDHFLNRPTNEIKTVKKHYLK